MRIHVQVTEDMAFQYFYLSFWLKKKRQNGFIDHMDMTELLMVKKQLLFNICKRSFVWEGDDFKINILCWSILTWDDTYGMAA